MPKSAAPRFKKRHGLKAESLNAVSQNGVGTVSASGGGFSRVGGGGGLGYVPPKDRTQSRFILAKLGAGEEITAPVYKYAWTEQAIVGDAVSERTPGRSGTLTDGYAISVGGGMSAEGRTVLLYAMPSDDPLKAYVVVRIDPVEPFWAILGTATLISGETTRWSYPFSAAKYESEGTYSTISGGLTGTAYNTIEAGNTGAGVEGCGINVDNLPTGWALKPIGAGAVVDITPVVNCDDQSIEYVFQAVNNADGTCP